ncbi:LysR family transcriptional regulator [Edaphobacter flagellatus]|uniref:LysR family transcriptional regulator n=1 Tax=Edaphobacter flagellatus TaxID=1933044 RepID=UPI0021B2F6C8|nr:LysR family transcriptional regulator [Edaphobacter flagellatus]
MDFDPVLLRAFVAVKETGGFTRAGLRLNLTQSAISHQIRRLEEQVGRPLLHRTTRHQTLTEDGEEFLRHAERILASLDALTQRFQPSPVSGVVRFGVPESFMGDRLPPLLCQFARAFPSVRLDISVTTYLDLRSMIEADELDLAVVLCMSGKKSELALRQTQFVWVAADTFDAPPHGSLPLALAPAQCVNRQVGLAALAKTPVEWHVVFTSPSHQGLRAAVLAGLGVTVLTRDDLEPGMKIVDGQYGLPSLPKINFTLVWGKSGQTLASREFAQMILNMPQPRRKSIRSRKA